MNKSVTIPTRRYHIFKPAGSEKTDIMPATSAKTCTRLHCRRFEANELLHFNLCEQCFELALVKHELAPD